eukprot:TRINITY_DN9117_c0_g1_i1.p1 TRINITY_DN9117_c0_g1~~TRINITY_DN9117_c0_g1_i1.p1  ORF type:complete len:219 (-),score=49.40 TRINITY_DN9117_c0_g1_i1:97-753(-)
MLKLYLTAFNVTQLTLWIIILHNATTYITSNGGHLSLTAFMNLDFAKVWNSSGDLLLYNQLLSIMEIVHPALGFIRGGVVPALTQVAGRGHQFLLVSFFATSLQSLWWSTLMLLVWGSIELIRYPFYLFALWNVSFYPLVWLRYTVWIPFYPTGMTAEFMLAFYGSSLVENEYYHFVLLALLPASLFYFYPSQLMYMWSQRKKVIGGVQSTSKKAKQN